MIEQLCERFGIGGSVRDAALRAYECVRNVRYPAQEAVHSGILRAFYDEGIAESDLAGSTGYGYDDAARERYESLLARVFGAERALARLSIVSGTHAIVTALAACVPPGKTLISVAGRPYDTLRNAICTAPHSLVAQGVLYEEIALTQQAVSILMRLRAAFATLVLRRSSCNVRAGMRRAVRSQSMKSANSSGGSAMPRRMC